MRRAAGAPPRRGRAAIKGARRDWCEGRAIIVRLLTRAMLAIGRERTIAAAAHASDFADAVHLTRTFYQIFGIPPSVMRRGEFFAIASPFGTTG